MTTRALDAADLPASFAAASAALAAAPVGSAEIWVVPPGVVDLAAGIVAGAAGRSLTVRGDDATLAVGMAAPVAGSAVVLDLVGADVRVEGLTLRVRSTGDAAALRVRATGSGRLADVRVDGVEGESATGVDAAGPGGSLVGVVVRDVVAAAGEAAGVVLDDGLWSLSRVRLGPVGGRTARGLRARTRSLTGTDLQVGQVSGSPAEALLVRCTDELSLLDVRVAQVSGTGDAAGLVAVCGGDVAVRGVSVERVEGARAAGALVVAGHEVDWSGGQLRAVRATTGGAVGVRVLAAPERVLVRLDDLSVEEVSGAQPGLVAEPAESWRTWLDAATAALASGAELPR